MNIICSKIRDLFNHKYLIGILCAIIIATIFPINIFSVSQRKPVRIPQQKNDSLSEVTEIPQFRLPRQPYQIVITDSIAQREQILLDSIVADSTVIIQEIVLSDSINELVNIKEKEFMFNPDPTRAVWLSALCPGLGQIYNRRYWKLPIIVGGYMGLIYATSWNNRMLSDYTNAYRDIMDTDPATKSYMDFFPPTVKEESLDKTWLTNTLKSRKNYFRQNRDLCIICMVGVYLLAMVDAYVDASLSQFDISPDISMQVSPTIMQESRDKLPSVGMHWALCF